MVEAFEIIDGISRYLRQEVSSRVFRDWMVGLELKCEADKAQLDPKDTEKAVIAANLLSEIDALYAQFADGHLPELSMRHELAKLVLSGQVQTQALTVFYSFLRPQFGSPNPNAEWGASEVGSEQPNKPPHSNTRLVAA